MIKSYMGYNQRQVAMLGVAKDLGDAIGFIAGSLCEVLPIWMVLFIGVVQNFVGYGLVWLIVIGALPAMPLWVVSLISFPNCFIGLIEDFPFWVLCFNAFDVSFFVSLWD